MRLDLDRDSLAPALEIVREFDELRPGLGLLFLMVLVIRLSSRMGNIGRGIMLIGPKSFGKGSLSRGTRTDKLGQDITADDIRRRWLTKYLHGKRTKGEPVQHLQLTVEDLSSVADDRKTLGHLINLVSLLISDLEYSPKGSFDYDDDDPEGETFRFESVGAVIGTTNRLHQRLMRYHNWSSMAIDRITRVGIIYTKDDLNRQDELLDNDAIAPTSELEKLSSQFIPTEIPQVTISIEKDELRSAFTYLYGPQHTRRRGRQYLSNDLKALAAICGDEVAGPAHMKLWKLTAPYLEVGGLEPQRSAIVSHASGGITAGELSRETGGAPAYLLDLAGYLASGTPKLMSIRHNPPHASAARLFHGPDLRLSLESVAALRQRRET